MKPKRQTKENKGQEMFKRDHEFSEELSDNGERDRIIKKQSKKSNEGM